MAKLIHEVKISNGLTDEMRRLGNIKKQNRNRTRNNNEYNRERLI